MNYLMKSSKTKLLKCLVNLKIQSQEKQAKIFDENSIFFNFNLLKRNDITFTVIYKKKTKKKLLKGKQIASKN